MSATRVFADSMLLRDTSALAHFQHRGTRSEYRDDEPLASQLAAVYMAGMSEIFRVPLAGSPEGLALAEVVGARAAAPKSSLNIPVREPPASPGTWRSSGSGSFKPSIRCS